MSFYSRLAFGVFLHSTIFTTTDGVTGNKNVRHLTVCELKWARKLFWSKKSDSRSLSFYWFSPISVFFAKRNPKHEDRSFNLHLCFTFHDSMSFFLFFSFLQKEDYLDLNCRDKARDDNFVVKFELLLRWLN